MSLNGNTPEPAEQIVAVPTDVAHLLVELAHLCARGLEARGGQEADDGVSVPMWHGLILGQVTAACMAAEQAASGLSLGSEVLVSEKDLIAYRSHLLAAAELCLAAIGALVRKLAQEPGQRG